MMSGVLRPATAADRPEMLALLLAEDAAYTDAPPVSDDEAFDHLDSFPHGVVFERGGRAAGYAATDDAGRTVLLVDPDEDPAAVLDALVGWLAERDRHEVVSYAADERRIAWLEGHGFAHVRSFFDLSRAVDPPPPEPRWPDGTSVAAFRPGIDDAAVHALVFVDAAWAEVAGHVDRPFERWRSSLVEDDRGWVARRDGRPVGWVLGRVFPDGRGWVQELAVARPVRGAGLGRALLLHGLADLRARGATSFALGVQGANDHAVGLYRDVGFAVDREWRVFTPRP